MPFLLLAILGLAIQSAVIGGLIYFLAPIISSGAVSPSWLIASATGLAVAVTANLLRGGR